MNCHRFLDILYYHPPKPQNMLRCLHMDLLVLFYTKLDNPSIAKLGTYFPQLALEGCSRALNDLHGHGLLVCVQSNPNTVIAHPRLLVQTANERRVLAVVATNGSYPGHTGPLVGRLAGWGGQGWGRPRSPDVAPSHPGVPT